MPPLLAQPVSQGRITDAQLSGKLPLRQTTLIVFANQVADFFGRPSSRPFSALFLHRARLADFAARRLDGVS
jgi:hypothetical protein